MKANMRMVDRLKAFSATALLYDWDWVTTALTLYFSVMCYTLVVMQAGGFDLRVLGVSIMFFSVLAILASLLMLPVAITRRTVVNWIKARNS